MMKMEKMNLLKNQKQKRFNKKDNQENNNKIQK